MKFLQTTYMVKDTLSMCLELKGIRTFWAAVVSPILTPTRPQMGTRGSRHLPRALPPSGPTGLGEGRRACSQAADGRLFQDSERAGHPGVLHGWLCGIPRLLPGGAWRPAERGGEGRTPPPVACVLHMLWSHGNGHDSSGRPRQLDPLLLMSTDTLFLNELLGVCLLYIVIFVFFTK